ncbi:MAG: SMC family ATPase, partial [Anaerolineales bacterium]|nr:SMC family ATPase [Anaerolineales bacterium]
MIPLKLRISGFLSYRDSIELNFVSINLACISGHNGAGKSSLLDAFTWALFGEARGRGMDVINLSQDVKAAEVALTFEYEGNIYRVQRTLPRGKSTVLEFQVLDAESGKQKAEGGTWRPLTEKTTRETQSRIEQTLQLDYETFINASFFLQGKADQFTQKKASERKAILSTILGLEIWDTYKERTAEKRKLLERDVDEIDGRIAEIDAELSEEDTRKARLQELETNLKQLSDARSAQEKTLESIKNTAAILKEQGKLLETLAKSLENSRASLAGFESRLAEKESELAQYADLVTRAKEIESTYKVWQKTRADVEKMDQIAVQFREHDEKRQPLLREIEVEKAKLEQEMGELSRQYSVISNQLSVVGELEKQLEIAQKSLDEAEEKIKDRAKLETSRNEARERQAVLKVENESLRGQMDELKIRIDALSVADGAECPLCGQPLSDGHRKSTLKQLEGEGKQKGDAFRANTAEAKALDAQITEYASRITQLSNAENERLKFSNSISQLTLQLESVQTQNKEWEKSGAKRLKEITKSLESGKFAGDAKKELAKLDKELTKLGYDISAHDAKRKEELELREVEADYRKLDSAREVSKRIESEIKELGKEVKSKQEEVVEQETRYTEGAAQFAKSEAGAPNLQEAESKFLDLKEEENNVRRELGGAEQRVKILDIQRARKADYESQREELNQNILRHKLLERAFGKDGVPALLIEQALPQIEQKANDLLDRLSDGQMSI